ACNVGGGRGLGIEAASRVAREWSADVLLLQGVERGTPEALGADQARELADALDMDLAWLPLNARGPGAEGLAILSRVRIERVVERPFGLLVEGRPVHGALGAEIDWAGEPLLLWSVCVGREDST